MKHNEPDMKNPTKIALSLAAAATIATSCGKELTKSGLDPRNFVNEEGTTALYTLKNASGMEVCLTNFGARIVSIMVPDRNGEFRDVVLGFDNIDDYLTIPSNFGATVGRYANRIAGGRMVLDGKEYNFFKNNMGVNCLHGGKIGWDSTIFDVKEADERHITFTLVSPDGDEGFPGTVEVAMTFTLRDDNSLDLHYEAVTDAPTVINMTNHSYFNLSGNPANDVLDFTLYIDADNCTPTDRYQIPTGEIVPVEGTPFDFRKAKVLGDEIDADNEQLRIGGGWDHNWVLNHPGDLLNLAAECVCPETGIVLDVYTQEPGLQVYSGNFLAGEKGKHGIAYNKRTAICLESQHYPDSPNHPEFPSTVLRPGEKYDTHTVFAFKTVE